MSKYLALNNQVIKQEDFSLVPIRFEDRYQIMKWRNEQMYHLRQEKPLTTESQDLYFKDVVSKQFNQKYPNQILFSYLNGIKCIGYGGLVHINWEDKNAEVSFIMNTELESTEFKKHWNIFLTMINKVAVNDLCLIKTYTYAFDLRPRLYSTLEDAGYILEAKLKKHKKIDDKFIDILIHSKINEYN
jgi:RimJ/RimL family protein N-acetyltransferase